MNFSHVAGTENTRENIRENTRENMRENMYHKFKIKRRVLTALKTALMTIPVTLLGSSSAYAYNMHGKGTIHEGLTALAEDCVLLSGGAQPRNCDTTGLADHASWSLFANYSDFQTGARWSDDPTRFVLKSGFPNFVKDMTYGCESRLEEVGDDKARRAELGLLCNSHYGDLQFLHAMASSTDETYEESIARMTDWARLSYRVATGEIGPSIGYCDYLRPESGEGAAGVISEDLLAAGQPFCEDRDKKFLFVKIGTFPKWRVHTLFSMTCRNPFQSSRCSEAIGLKGVAQAQKGASGALLHLVQDSYSQSHAVRDPAADEAALTSIANCKPILHFYEYSQQVSEGVDHSAADHVPALHCEANSQIDDPITASANIIWFINQGQNAEDKRQWENQLIAYLTAHVFGSRPDL